MRFFRLGEENCLSSGCFPGSSITSDLFFDSMKTSWLTIVLLVFAASRIQGQVSQSGPPAIAGQGTVPVPDTSYAVVSKGANQQVWQRTTYEMKPDGKQIPHIHQYTELATGLHYWNNGQWVDSKEEINILPNSTAAAIHGQHQAYFSGNIYQGVIELVTPDGKHLQSRPLGLSYDDGTNTVLIAELTNSVGYLVGSNQVIYPDAFTDFKADLRYTYTKAGIEQDVVLREQLPGPESYGLNPATARLQVLTEFFNPPQPAVTATMLPQSAGTGLTDENLNFGTMRMGRGKAFLIGNSAKATPVSKSWQRLEGRTFLVEELPLQKIAAQLEQLPMPANASTAANPAQSVLHKVSATRLLTPVRMVQTGTNTIQLAKADFKSQPGLVLDYVTINSTIFDSFIFQGDTTYYVSDYVESMGGDGIVTIEGGSVIKFARGADLDLFNPVSCATSPYRPAILTAIDDNTVGETISGSTGNPSGTYADIALAVECGIALTPFQNLRISYANMGLACNSNVYNCQFINDGTAIMPEVDVMVGNVLLDNIGTGISSWGGSTVNADFVTAHHVNTLVSSGFTLNITNSLFVCVTNWGHSFTGAYNATNLSDSGVFQTVGAGGHYLADNSSYRNAGTTSIDPTLLSALQQKTTYPPIVYTTAIISNNLTFSPQAPRDTNGSPDLGYHYDPLDYVFGGVDLYSNLIITAGTAVGWYEDYGNVDSSEQPYGISLNDGANLTSSGTAILPSWIVRYNTVQEGGNGNWTATGCMGGIMFNGSHSGITPQLNGHFTKWASSPGVGSFFQDNSAYGVGSFSDCEFYGSAIASYWPSLYFTNCLFSRVFTAFWDQSDAANFTFQNCTFYEGALAMARGSGQTPSFWTVRNSAFDGTAFSWDDNFYGDTNYTAFDYNAYNSANTNWLTYPYPYPPNHGTLEVVGPQDVIVTNGYNWQSSWLGNYYLPTNSWLIDMGNTNANLLGLYHFTTQTNQVKEGNSIVDIGYHYVAVDGNGNPIDTNGDGIPDYLEDTNGNGIYDAGDLGNWLISPFNGLTTAKGLLVFTPLR